MKQQFNVTGMTCAACAARVEKAVNSVDGVTECAVSLLTNSMGVEGTADAKAVIKAVTDAGYGASVKGSGRTSGTIAGGGSSTAGGNVSVTGGASDYEDSLKDTETPKLFKRLISSVIFLIVIMYISMGHMMLHFPLPKFLSNPISIGLIELLLTTVVMIINNKFFISGFRSLINRAPNMDTLVALGAGASYGYSVVILFLMANAAIKGLNGGLMAADAMALLHEYHDDLYFESAATILTLITVGKMLEARSKGKTVDALKSLMKLAPKTARVLRNNEEKEIPVDEVIEGDTFLVKPGESIPVDGVVTDGVSAVDESSLTGESIPVDKMVDDKVCAATINKSGYLTCRATRVGEDTTFSQIIKMMSDAAATKAPIAKIADRVSGVFVPTVIVIAFVTLIVWLIAGYDIGFSLSRAIAVLVISCPCALGLATPVAIMVGSGVGAKSGILYKTAASLEAIAGVDTIVLDKTGTITNGTPVVTDVISGNAGANQENTTIENSSCKLGGSENYAENINERLVHYAASLERKSEHPLATAICKYAEEKGVAYYDVTDFEALPGHGLKGKINGEWVYGGNAKYISEILSGNCECSDADVLSKAGKTPLLFATDKEFLGIIAVADTVKEDSKNAISELKNMGIHVVMLTGDNEGTAKAIGAEVGVDEIVAGVLPDGKEAVIRKHKENGRVAMVGDGINDAPALVSADVGIAIGAGTDVAIDAADIVLVKSRLSDAVASIRLGKKTLTNIKENLFWAFIYNVIGIPLAAGVWYPLFGLKLNPMFGAAAMSLSSFCVVTNALRLNLAKIYDGRHDARYAKKAVKLKPGTNEDVNETNHIKNIFLSKKENKPMEKILIIEGMMCNRCESHVKKALEAIDGVTEATASHVDGTAIVKLSKDVADEVLIKAVKEEDYEVKAVEVQ